MTTVVRPLTVAELGAVANVHIEVFSQNVHSQLGPAVVRRHFEWQLEKRTFVHANGAFDQGSGALLGFGFGGLYGEPKEHFMRSHLPLVFSMAARRPAVAVQLISRRLRRPVMRQRRRISAGANSEDDDPDHGVSSEMPLQADDRLEASYGAALAQLDDSLRYYEIFSLAVTPARQGQGLGKQLMRDHEELAVGNGFTYVRLRAPLDNDNTIAFYQRIGFRKVLEPGHDWLGQMVKRL